MRKRAWRPNALVVRTRIVGMRWNVPYRTIAVFTVFLISVCETIRTHASSDMAGRDAALLQVALVIFFGAIEDRRGHNLGDDPPVIAAGFFQLLLGSSRCGFLLGRVEENCGAVLCTPIGSLPVERGGIMVAPENIQQLIVRDLGGIEGHLHRLSMAGFIAANVLVGRVFERASGVAYGCVFHSLDLAEGFFHAPEASGAKCSFFHDLVPLLIIRRCLDIGCRNAGCWLFQSNEH